MYVTSWMLRTVWTEKNLNCCQICQPGQFRTVISVRDSYPFCHIHSHFPGKTDFAYKYYACRLMSVYTSLLI